MTKHILLKSDDHDLLARAAIEISMIGFNMRSDADASQSNCHKDYNRIRIYPGKSKLAQFISFDGIFPEKNQVIFLTHENSYNYAMKVAEKYFKL